MAALKDTDAMGDHESAEELFGIDAMRSWLVSGVHFVDPRRRFGSHGRARELLVPDPRATQNVSERWQALAAALHRHTVRGGLSELRPDERHVITLAYLEGRTNREIATLLGVSVATVQRRLLFALGRLEAYIGRSGVWLSAFLLVAAAYLMRPGAYAVRWVNTAATSPERAHRIATTLTAGAMSAAVLGAVAFTSDSAVPGRAPRNATQHAVTPVSVAAAPVASISSKISAPLSVQPAVVVERTSTTSTIITTKATTKATGADTDADVETADRDAHKRHGKGCDHKSTNDDIAGSPVSEPEGCGDKDG